MIEISDATQHQRISRENRAADADRRQPPDESATSARDQEPARRAARRCAAARARAARRALLREYTSVIISEADRLAGLVDAMLGPGQRRAASLINIHEIAAARAPPARGRCAARSDRSSATTIEPAARCALDRNLSSSRRCSTSDRNALQAVALNASGKGRIVLRTRACTNVKHRRAPTSAGRQRAVRGRRPGACPSQLRGHALLSARDRAARTAPGLGLAVAQDLGRAVTTA